MVLEFIKTGLKDSYLIKPSPFSDNRGIFVRTFCQTEFEKHGLCSDFKQTNLSYSYHRGTLRGMHYQIPPSAEVKLVRCIKGRVYDVIIDIRSDSLTFGKWFGTELSAENQLSLYVPGGFAHGFLTLEAHSEVLYQVSNNYNPENERGIRFDDPRININWPGFIDIVSDKDKSIMLLPDDFRGIKV